MFEDISVAVAHKDYDVSGGGEILSERLSTALNAPLYVGHGGDENEQSIEIAPDSYTHKLMDRSGVARLIGHIIHWRDRSPDVLDDYDVVVLSGSEPLWRVPPDTQGVIAYTHTPPRWVFDLYNEEVDGLIGRTWSHFLRHLYQEVSNYPDVWVANSDVVARRIHRYFNISYEDIEVVYPPVDTSSYSPSEDDTQDFYLYLGRMAGHKRVGEIVEAFNSLERDLVVAGDGPMKDDLEKKAESNIEFLGYVSNERKKDLLTRAKALVYNPLNEDFGMVPIEAMAAGTPVIGVNEGFTCRQIVHGCNGYLYDRSIENMESAVEMFENKGVSWDEERISEFAKSNFSVDRFEEEMREIVEQTHDSIQSQVTPNWKATE